MSEFIMIKNARVSFPHLFTKPIINGDEGKCGATLMLEPAEHKNTIAAIKSEMQSLIKDRLKGKRLSSDKLCLRDGADKGRDEYEGYIVLSANSKTRPVVLSSNGRDIVTDEDDCAIYAGCYVNAKVRLWAQDNKYGKRINSELVAIQFAADGESLDDSHVSVGDAMEGFDNVGGVDDDDDDDDFLAA